MAEQTKKRSITTDDETSKTSANHKKKKQIQRLDDDAKSPKSVSEENPGLLPCQGGTLQIWTRMQIVCILIIRFENNKWDCFVQWGPKTHLQLLLIAICAANENEMKIFKIKTLTKLLGRKEEGDGGAGKPY